MTECDPMWAIIPARPFDSITPADSPVAMLPMRGSSARWDLVSRISGVPENALIDMQIGDELPARNDSIVRRIR